VPREVRITHPFHPRCGEVVEYSHTATIYGSQRVFFRTGAGVMTSIPKEWTSLVPEDPFVVASAGRARLRVGDLLELADLLEELTR